MKEINKKENWKWISLFLSAVDEMPVEIQEMLTDELIDRSVQFVWTLVNTSYKCKASIIKNNRRKENLNRSEVQFYFSVPLFKSCFLGSYEWPNPK